MKNRSAMRQTLELVRQRGGLFKPEIAIILGSGLGGLAEHLEKVTHIPYAELPLFPHQGLSGHLSQLSLGDLFGHNVALFSGRFHVYQGLSCFESTAPVQLAAEMGCRAILLTCAVGGIAAGVRPGDFLLVNDHLNLSGINPLQGIDPPAFIDLYNCYRHEFLEPLKSEAKRLKRSVHSGVLAYMTGPSYETPAEIAALRLLGASAVSMSTVPEAIMAQALGLQVAVLALVTNLGGGSAAEKLSHQEVLACSAAAAEPFSFLVKMILSNFAVN